VSNQKSSLNVLVFLSRVQVTM